MFNAGILNITRIAWCVFVIGIPPTRNVLKGCRHNFTETEYFVVDKKSNLSGCGYRPTMHRDNRTCRTFSLSLKAFSCIKNRREFHLYFVRHLKCYRRNSCLEDYNRLWVLLLTEEAKANSVFLVSFRNQKSFPVQNPV